MSWEAYCDWYHFYLLEPFGDAKDDWYRSQMLYTAYRSTFPESDVSLTDNCRYTELHIPEVEVSEEPISDDDLKRKVKNMGR